VVNNALFMAGTEMREIQELDHDTINLHASKIYGFYGRTDGWVPLDHYSEMKEKLPSGLFRRHKFQSLLNNVGRILSSSFLQPKFISVMKMYLTHLSSERAKSSVPRLASHLQASAGFLPRRALRIRMLCSSFARPTLVWRD
jgi:hypothetical protein